MNVIATTLPFRGNRTYLQGSALFTLLTPLANQATNIVFRVNKAIRNNSIKVLSDVAKSEILGYPCTLTWDTGGEQFNLAIAEDGVNAPTLREPFDDTSVINHAIFSNDSISIQHKYTFTFIELAVALNKALLKGLFPQPNGTQYIFTRIELKNVPIAFTPMRIKFSRRVGSRHFISSVYLNDENVGAIHFSLWINEL